MTFLEIALQLALGNGWYVFPCVPKNKRPLTAHGFQDASIDESQIRAWWTKWPDANVAISCGPSGLVVLDVDHGIQTEEQLQQWCARNGFPMTYTVRTGRRPEFGAQLYYSGELRGIDFSLDGALGQTRGQGQYVMAAGCVHPSGERYAPLYDTPLAPVPEALKRLKPLKVEVSASGVMVKIPEGGGRHAALFSLAGTLRSKGFDVDAILAQLLTANPLMCEVPVNEDDLEEMARRAGTMYEPQSVPPVATVGGRKPEAAPVDNVELVEMLDKSLTATPLPAYPIQVFQDTLYMEFAKRARQGNHVPLEFFIEGAMTVAGALVGDRLHGMAEEITPRLYTVLIAKAGVGKGTTFRRIRKFAPYSRLLNDVKEGFMPPACSALLDHAGSENGLNDALLKCSRVFEEFEELDKLFEKTLISGSGNALMGAIRTCFDDIAPGITTTSGRPVAAEYAYLSLLGAITPSLWRDSMEGRDSYGSGLGGRFNLVATNEFRTASTLTKMDAGDLHAILDKKLVELEADTLTIPTDSAALKLLDEWWNANGQGKTHYNRVNVIAHRKALHLAWIRGLPVITAEIMGQALLLAEYLVAVRDAFAVAAGEDKNAVTENRIMNVLRQIKPKAVRASQLVELLDGKCSRATVFRALKALTESGEVEVVVQKDPAGGRPFNVYRVSLI